MNMNPYPIFGHERALLDAILSHWQGVSRLPLRIEILSGPDEGADARLRLGMGSNVAEYDVELKQLHTRTQLAMISTRFADSDRPRLLFTEHFTPVMADAAQELGVQFMDAAGNAYLRFGDCLISISGQRLPKSVASAPRATLAAQSSLLAGREANTTSVAATKILFIILREPGRFHRLTQRVIAHSAGVSLGSVSTVLEAWEGRGLLRITRPSRVGAILEPEQLLQEFALSFAARLRSKLQPQRYSTKEKTWHAALDLAPFGALWGGEVAANRLVGDFVAGHHTVYVDTANPKNLNTLLMKHRLRPDPQGNITLLEKFWHDGAPTNHAGIVPPPLIYADLMAAADPRGVELAQRVGKHWLEHEIAAR